ncbi:hypothetical protein DM02DRAFT_674936 [Periconia macrospinosa]|uniref:Prion-inhibition and propagation HeLo domain-containing protein n=1 Tax=Periconia macrospinosa TaxID=97972 RepID=A0A2V1DE15_9PLEO|nr:hypothetical protein DM02DRAFT_674936 [Periconia macrospinosa]
MTCPSSRKSDRKAHNIQIMDPASLAIGLPGLIQTCIHAYRFVKTIIHLGKDAGVLRLRYKVEETRLTLWGRHWGLLKSEEELRNLRSSQALKDLLHLPGIQKLISDILDQIQLLLQDARGLSAKYAEALPVPQATILENGISTETNITAIPVKVKQNTVRKIKWAVNDKPQFESILTSLTNLNDGLDKLLPRHQKFMLEQALVAEVLSEEGFSPTDDGAKYLSTAFSADAEWKQSQEHCDEVEEDKSLPEVKKQQNMPDSMELAKECFVELDAKRNGFSIERLRAFAKIPGSYGFVDKTSIPITSKELQLDVQHNAQRARVVDQSSDSELVEESVFVEWRSYEETGSNELLQMALEVRREEFDRFFPDELTARTHHVLQCIGFVLPDKMTMGLVFRLPSGCIGEPTTLNDVLRRNFYDVDAILPDLEYRILLSKKLSTALYQLQCSGWLHRNISSHKIIFFRSSTNDGLEGLDLSRPTLIGWQTARYDDQIMIKASEGFDPTLQHHSYRKNEWTQNELPYVHPLRPERRARFKRSFDVYALGIVLAEIAFWEPIDVLKGNSDPNNLFTHFDQTSFSHELHDFSKLVLETCKKELAGEVGGRYQAAVLWMLEGVKSWHAQQVINRPTASAEDLDREVGLEKAFFWNVVNRLHSIYREE